MRGTRKPARGPANSYRRGWRDVVARYRRPVAAALAALAVASGLSAVAPDAAPRVAIAVSTRDLPSGHVIEPGDVESREVQSAALPPQFATQRDDAADLIGHQLAIAATAGTPLHEGLLVGEHLLAGTEPGTVAVPLQPADTETLSLLSPGLHVDVVLSEGNGYERPVESKRIARAVPVLWVPSAARGGLLDGPAPGGPQATVVVAASAEQAEALAGAASRGRLQLMLVAAAP
ncbi:Flp pilus assembly protein CpaB [Kocuria polaris]|nr:Flp pilus assembly protein CpaB [Kocuria polaris]